MMGLAQNHFRWAVSAGVAGAIVAAIAILFGRTDLIVQSAERPTLRLPIVFAAAQADELAMRDLTPLFLPTPYNASASIARPAEPGRAFFDHDPGQHVLFSEDDPQLEIPNVVVAPNSAAAAVTMPPPPLTGGFGRSNLSPPALPLTGGRVDLYAAGGGPSLLGVQLAMDAAPVLGGQRVSWQPLEFAAAVDAAGLVNSLVLTRSSGNEEVDAHFRNYLASRFHLGDRLPPGFYRVVVAP